MTEKRNPKEVTLSFLVICFARKQPVQRVRGRQDGGGRKRNQKRNKEMLKVRQLVSEWNYTISHSTILNHTDKDRKKDDFNQLKFSDIIRSNMKENYFNMQVEKQQFVKLSI